MKLSLMDAITAEKTLSLTKWFTVAHLTCLSLLTTAAHSRGSHWIGIAYVSSISMDGHKISPQKS